MLSVNEMAERLLEKAKGMRYQDGHALFAGVWHPDMFTDKLRNLEIYKDDVYFTGYMRSGTYIGLELVQLVLNNADIEYMYTTSVHERESHLLISRDVLVTGKLGPFDYGESPIPWLTNRKPPRIFKTHGLYEYAPYGVRQGQCKIVVQTRNPKSTYLSWYKILKESMSVHFPDITWEDFFAAAISGEGKHLILSSWFDFYLTWWKHRDHLDVYFLNYEAMFKDGRKVAKELAYFFGRTLTEEQITKILKYIDFEECKKNPTFSNVFKGMTALKGSPGHMRKIDDWKNYFTVAESEQFDKLYKEKMEGSGFPEPVYE